MTTLRRAAVALVALLLAGAVVAGAVTGAWALLGRSVLYGTGLWSPAAPSTPPGGVLERPTAAPSTTPGRVRESAPEPAAPASPDPVLALDRPGPDTDPDAVEAAVRGAGSLDAEVGWAGDGRRDRHHGRTPAGPGPG